MSQRSQQPALVLFAAGMIGLGVLGLALGDFAMGWQPVAAWFPARTALAYIAAVLMIVCGARVSCSARQGSGVCAFFSRI